MSEKVKTQKPTRGRGTGVQMLMQGQVTCEKCGAILLGEKLQGWNVAVLAKLVREWLHRDALAKTWVKISRREWLCAVCNPASHS